MPKRTNDFQRLVYLVRVNLSAGAKVTESKMLRDRITKRTREVDVCIEGQVGGQPVMICVECRDHKHPADVTWVEAIKGKHERLPTNALLLASRSGFTPEARRVAAAYSIETFALEDIESADYPSLLNAKSTLWTKSVTITPTKVLAKVPATGTLLGEAVVLVTDNLFYSADGKEICPANALIDMVLKSDLARDGLLPEGTEDHKWFELRWEPPSDLDGKPIFLKKLVPETLRRIESIQITGPCQFKITPFGLRRGLLGDIHIAWGKTEIEGQSAMVVATRDSLGIERLSVNITNNAGVSKSSP